MHQFYINTLHVFIELRLLYTSPMTKTQARTERGGRGVGVEPVYITLTRLLSVVIKLYRIKKNVDFTLK